MKPGVVCKTLLCLLLCLAMGLSLGPAEARAENVISAESTYYSVILKKLINWDFEYSDSWFEADADAYSHPIARASLGMALSAFRNQTEDSSISAYLTQLGFGDLSSQDYDKDTTKDTIATMMGHKTLPNGETLVAVAICGQGYKNEWLSNFDIGNGQEHRGFSSAAQKVVERVEQYLQEHQLSNARLWLSGYSRSAAVSNLVGAKLMEKGLFNEKNAFVYTFATPRTTKAPVDYSNIFNVVGKFDPVAKVPYVEWGFERHGTTLFTPAQETDSDYHKRQQAAAKPFYELTGLELWNDPVLNQHLSSIEAFLLANVPSTADYEEHVSQHVANAWTKPDTEAVLSVLEAMAAIPSPDGNDTPAIRQKRVDQLVNYVASALLDVVGGDSMAMGMVEEEQMAFSVPFVTEHIPDIYLAWMFSSDDPEQVFSDNMQYMQLVVSGDAEVNIFDQKGGFILSMDPYGTVRQTTENERYQKRIRPVEDRPLVTALQVDEQSIFVLPKDQAFPFTMIPQSESDLQYYGLYYDVRRSAPTMSSLRVLHMQPDEEYLGFALTPRGQALFNASEPLVGDADEMDQKFEMDQLLSVADAASLANLNLVSVNVRSTIRAMLIIVAVGLVLLILCIVLAVRILRRVVRRVRRKAKPSRA